MSIEKESNDFLIVTAGATATFTFVLVDLRVYWSPNGRLASFFPVERQLNLGVRGQLTRGFLNCPFNTSTGTSAVNVRIAGVDVETPPLILLPPLSTGQFDSGDLRPLDIQIFPDDQFSTQADRRGINAGQGWTPERILWVIELK